MTRPSDSPPPHEPGPDSSAPDARAQGPSGAPAREPRTGTAQGLRDALAALLRGAEGRASAEELADVLWVAELAGLNAEGDAPGGEEPPGPDESAAPEPPARTPTAQDAPGPVSPGPAETTAGPDVATPSAEPRVGLHPYAAAAAKGPDGTGDGTAGHAVLVAQPPALDGALALARALRPLRQSVTTPGVPLLDEEATAQASGEAGRGRLVPAWRPAVRRRFSVDLVVDSGATMAVWHRLAAELCTVLERHGAFADVRCWALDTDGAAPRLMPFRRRQGQGEPHRAVRFPGPLEDSSGRRVLLVLTDGVGPAWYGADLPGFLARTAAQRPAAALQVLPRRLWHRTALRTVPVELRVPDPARPVPVVRTDAALPGRPAPRAVRWLPVMEVKGSWLAPWAELVAGRAPGWSPMLAAPVRGVPRPRRAVAPAPPADPAERVARFRSGASPDAFRLACHLAAAPLSLPVMRLVQQATMPAPEQTDLAELFLSGLIARRGPAGPEPDEVVYDFAPGVRDELLAELTRTESLRVLDDVLAKVSGRVAATFGGTLDFRALAARADGAAPGAPADSGTGGGEPGGDAAPGHVLPPASLPFAEVAVAVLSGAGGQHRALARRLAAAVEGRTVPGPAVPRQGAPRDQPTVTARVVSQLPFPEQLVPVPPLRVPPDLEQMIGRAYELDELKRQLQPPMLRHTVVVVEGRLGMGARRLVQEYARRYGDRHAFVHWIDASRPESLAAGLRSLGAALGRTPGPGDARDDVAETWRLLARHENWLLVLDDLGPEYDLGDADSFLPPQGVGSVLITTRRVYDGRRRADAVIALDPLTPAEVADHVRNAIGPASAARDGERFPSVLNRLVARLSTLPGELARVDVRAEFARESAAARPGPRPLYEWRVDGRVTGLAGYGGSHVVVAVSQGPVRLYRASAGRVQATWLAEVERPVHAVATQTRPDGRVLLAVAHGSRVIWLDDPATSARLRPVGFVDFARGDARGPEGRPVGTEPADGGQDAAHGSLPDPPPVDVVTLVTREDGRSAVMTAGSEPPQQWDLGTGALLTTPPPIGAAGPVRALAVFDDTNARQRIAVVGDGTAGVWYLATGAVCDEPSPGLLSGATALATVRVPGRPDILAASNGGPVVRFWDSATGASAGSLDTRAGETLVAVAVLSSRHGASRLATARADGLIQLWDVGAALDPPDPYASSADAAGSSGTVPEEAADPELPTPRAESEPTQALPEPPWEVPPSPQPESAAAPDAGPEPTAEPEPEATAEQRAESAAAPDAEPPLPRAEAAAEPLFLAWVADEVGVEVGVSADVLTLLLPGSERLIPELVAAGVLERTTQDRFRLAELHRGPARAELFDLLPEPSGLLRANLLRLLDAACPEATSDTSTWAPYHALRVEMPSLMARMLDTGRRYAPSQAADLELVLGIAARWAWYHLLRGAFASADRLVSDAEAWVNRFGPAGVRSDGPLADLRGQLRRISLRANLALGHGRQVAHRVEQITATARPQQRDYAEGQLALAETALWGGELERSDDLLTGVWRTLARDIVLTADDAMSQRGRLLQAQHDLAAGRLRDAMKGVSRARTTVASLHAQAETEAQAVAELAGGRTGAGEGAGDSLEWDPAFETARAAGAALDVVLAELALAIDDLTPPRTAEELPAALDAARRRMRRPSGDGDASLASFADSVPDAYLHHYLRLCEQYTLALVRNTTGPLWGTQGLAGRPRPALDAAVTATLDLVEPYRARQSTSRVLAYAGFLTVRGEAALAAGQPGPALGLFAQARSLIEDRYGPSCPRLPRLRLLQARGNHAGGMESPARRYVAEAEGLLDALHGDAPHQDRVTLLRAQAALAPDEDEAANLTQRAEQVAFTLLDGVASPPLWPAAAAGLAPDGQDLRRGLNAPDRRNTP